MARKDTPKQRRTELSRMLREKGIERAVISNPKNIFYLTGFSSNLSPYKAIMKGQRPTAFLALRDDGESSLLAGGSELGNAFTGSGGAPAVEGYDGGVALYRDYDLDVTMVPYANDQVAEVRAWLQTSVLAGRPRKVGIEDWHLASIYEGAIRKASPDSGLVEISEMILEMRMTKGRDELEYIRQANRILDYAYKAARETAVAGKTEFEVFAQMNRAALERFGPLAVIASDVVSGPRSLEVGGPATKRRLKRGDTMILDAQATHNNYWSDTARTFVVGAPSQRQKDIHGTLVAAKNLAAKMLKPGASASSVAGAIDEFLAESRYPRMIHHAGHAVGLDDQERPWLIRGARDKIEEDQAYVIEPGVYDREAGGIRVEDCYLVTSDGVEKVSRFSLDL
ncbi:MAG: Xaa-Pro peptidase family protein [Thaumarchaeota archaeon]|nr:Xaa-Pro peptidase family protein [Nitrososphaerota archaeon]